MEIKERSTCKVLKLSSNNFNVRTTAARFQKQPATPKRFKLLPSSISSPTTKMIKSVSVSPETYSPQKVSPYSEFLPELKKRIYIADPDSSTTFHRSPKKRIQQECTSWLSSAHSKSSELQKKVELFKQECFKLQNKIINETCINKSELKEASNPKSVHPLTNDYFKEVKLGNLLGVQTLLVMNPELINEVDSTLQTSLHWAIRRSDIRLVRLLLSSGANIKVQDSAGRSAEMLAQKSQSTEIQKLFFKPDPKKKPDPNTSQKFESLKVFSNIKTWFKKRKLKAEEPSGN
jgi:hypothetical protein